MLIALTSVAAAVVASASWAAAPLPPGADLTLTPNPAHVLERVDITGMISWGKNPPEPGNECKVSLGGTVLTSATCSYDSKGIITGGFVVPEGTPVGQTWVYVCGIRQFCGGELTNWEQRTDFEVVADTVVVPDLHCRTYDDARAAVEGVGLVFSPAVGTTGPVGTQSPGKDEPADKGSTVSVGPAVVPELRGTTYDVALAAVTDACGVLAYENDRTGRVEDQRPLPGVPMPADGKVTAIFPETPTVSADPESPGSSEPTGQPTDRSTGRPTTTPSPASTDTSQPQPSEPTETGTRSTSSSASPDPTSTTEPPPVESSDDVVPPRTGRDDPPGRPGNRPRWVTLTSGGAVVTSLLVGGVLLLRTRGALGGLPPDLLVQVQDRATDARLDDRGDGLSHVLVRRAPTVRLEEDPDDH